MVNFYLGKEMVKGVFNITLLKKQNIVAVFTYTQSQCKSFYLLRHLAHPQHFASAAFCQALK